MVTVSFENEEFGLILEDDCIPAQEFLTYANYSKKIIETNGDVWLFCGTQFAPYEKSVDSWSLSKYALIWGWGTSKRNWNQIASSLRKDGIKISSKDIGFTEKQYWSAGAKRSNSGVIDADTIQVKDIFTGSSFRVRLDGINAFEKSEISNMYPVYSGKKRRVECKNSHFFAEMHIIPRLSREAAL